VGLVLEIVWRRKKQMTYHRSQDALPINVVVSPNWQSRHCVASGSVPFLAYPLGHALQSLPNAPAPHAWHFALPFVESHPNEQATHSIERSCSAFLPAGHSKQSELFSEPLFSFFLPAGQLLQSVTFVTPVADEYVP
jgi:hypothetical protein